jgi:hypothetical protein
MSEQPRDEQLSTADLAAAADRRATEPSHEPTYADRDVTLPEQRGADSRDAERSAPLFDDAEANDLRGRWADIQAGFVDEPRRAVEQADGLVAATIKRLAEVFADERSKLEQQWDRGDNISTEDLRVALRRYRSFFDRLLSV